MKVEYDESLSNFAFNFNPRRYTEGDYAPDILNPYSIHYSLDPSDYRVMLTNKMRAVHKAGAYTRDSSTFLLNLRNFVTETQQLLPLKVLTLS